MDTNAIITAITTVGFPIVMCAALFWLIIKNDALHKEEMDKMSEAINNNTLIMTKLYENMSENKK